MEPSDNVRHPPIDQRKKNLNPPQPLNLNTKIDEGLDTLRTLVEQLSGTIEPRKLSLTTSLDIIVRSIASSQGDLTSISKYRTRMFEY
jgi:hypothetical protein